MFGKTDFKKMGKSGFGKMANLFGKEKKDDPIFKPKSFVPKAEDPREEQEKVWARTLEDDALAKRCYRLFKKWPGATLPELVVYVELKKRNIQFDYQVEILGGRGTRGGLVPDFLINRSGDGLAIEVQGSYWHEGAEKEEKDRTDAMRMKGVMVRGTRIKWVVSVWDKDLYPSKRRREFTIENALAGISVRMY